MFWNFYSYIYGLVCKLEPYQEMIREVVQNISSNSSILDAGCGTGNLVAEIMKQGKQVSYTGIDATPHMLKRARKAYPEFSFSEANLDQPLPFPENSFDYIVSVNVLYILPNSESVISEFRRLLKTGGKMIICTPLAGSDPGIIFKAHLRKVGWKKTLPYLLPFLALGAMNLIILRKSSQGIYRFFSEEEVKRLINCESLTKTYADQDWLAIGE